MAHDSTPNGRKRPRSSDINNDDPAIASSAKKRRLTQTNAISPTTPRTLHAIASAVSGAFGFGRRSSTKPFPTGKDTDKSYEVPDSDEERRPAPSKKAPLKRKTSSQKSDIYDIPDSGDELGTAEPVSQLSEEVGYGEGRQPLLNGTSTPRRRKAHQARRSEDDADDLGLSNDEDEDRNESPSKLRSSRKSNRSLPYGASLNDRANSPIEETRQDGIPVAPTSSGRKRRNPLDDLAIDGTPKLKGILTPSRRGRQKDRPRKSVAFDQDTRNVKEEVFFADLPTKAATSKKKSRAESGPPLLHVRPEVQAEEVEDVSEDEEVCAICSKPHSKPPNEIIFCDNCDMAVHQKCYGVSVIPDGDWLCRDCTQEDTSGITRPAISGQAPSKRTADEKVPNISNFDHHLRALQRVLLDRCAGRRRLKPCGLDEAYEKAFQLVEQTVLGGEGNSMLVIGARGCGKTTLVESIVADISKSNKEEFHVIRLNGFIHTDDKLALKEIWRQLGKEMEVEDEVISKTNNYADTLTSLLSLLSHPSEISEAKEDVTSKSVVFIIDEFDMFATHARQTLLYNLFDIAQAKKAPIAVLGLTTRIDVVESLEKRVKSRFSHRYVYLSLPKSLLAYWEICKQGLTIDDQDMANLGLDVKKEGHTEFHQWWATKIEVLYKEASFQEHLEFHYYRGKSVASFLMTCVLPLASLSSTLVQLRIPLGGDADDICVAPPDSKLQVLESLSDLDLSLLIAAARLDIVAHTDTVNFAMAYDEYTSLMSKQRVQSATSGMLAMAGGSRVWGRGVAGMAWERLVSLSLLIPAGGGGRTASGHGGVEAKMWKLDVALEEIPTAAKLNNVLARWCKEI